MGLGIWEGIVGDVLFRHSCSSIRVLLVCSVEASLARTRVTPLFASFSLESFYWTGTIRREQKLKIVETT